MDKLIYSEPIMFKTIKKLLIFFSLSFSHFLYAQSFSCSTDSYIFNGVTNTDAYSVSFFNGNYRHLRANLPARVNATGYNVRDNHVWGYDINTNRIIRIDASLNIVSYYVPGLPGKTFYAGDVSLSGILYLHAHGDTTIYRVNLNGGRPRYAGAIGITKGGEYGDFAFNPLNGLLYTVNEDDAHLYSINVHNGHVSDLGDPGLGGDINFHTFVFDRDGNLYFLGPSGVIYKIPVSYSNRASVFSRTGIRRSGGDGARCPLAPIKPLRGKFNIERTNSANYAIGSSERNAWYTQLAGRDFNASLVFYNESMTAEQEIEDVTVKIELIDLDHNNRVLYTDIRHINTTPLPKRVDILSSTDLKNLPSTRNAVFRITYAIDHSGNIIQTDCRRRSNGCNLKRSDDARNTFSIRPENFYMSIADGTVLRKENNNTLPDPLRVAAGYGYNLKLIASNYKNVANASLGYDATIERFLEFNTSGPCEDTRNHRPNITFLNGKYSDLDFTNPNVGQYILKPKDSTWTAIDALQSTPDCILGESIVSTHPNLRSGCNIDTISDINLSFYPYKFAVNFEMHNLPSSGHDDFIYMSDITEDEHNVSQQFLGTITAQNKQNKTTTNFTGTCAAEETTLNLEAVMVTDDGLIPIKTALHPTRNQEDVKIVRMARFNNEELNETTFDNFFEITERLTINPEKFLYNSPEANHTNGMLSLDLRYNVQKNLSLPINPVQVTFNSLYVESILSNSTAEGFLAPNYFPTGSQGFNSTLRNFYFSKISPDMTNYPRIFFNTNPAINTPLNVDIFCNSSNDYCIQTAVRKHTDQTGLSRVEGGWYLSKDHNTQTDGLVQELNPNKNILNVVPDRNIDFSIGRNASINSTFTRCNGLNDRVIVQIVPDLELRYDADIANNGNPRYTVSCTNRDAAEFSGVGRTGNLIDSQANERKTTKIDW